MLRPGLAGALRLRNLLRGRGAVSVPVLSGAMRPEVLLFLPAGEVRKGKRPRELERQLWAGYSRYALPELRNVAAGRDVAPQWRAEACWVLARWHSAHGDYERALDYAVLMRSVRPAEAWFKGQILLEVDCLNRLGREVEAREILDQVLGTIDWHPDYGLAYANTYAISDPDADDRLVWMNRGLESAGFAPIQRLTLDAPLTIDNLSAPSAAPGSRVDGPLVSVLMPAYNSAATIDKALRGLLEQTWGNLEIIPVDDCSTDETWEVLQAFARQDSRIRPLRHETNTGAYGARLTALEQARGEFITVHDADDWSHPQKLEVQVGALLAEPELVATMTSWCRVSRNLYVNRVGVIPSGNLQRQNESSLMFRRSLVDTLGAWDKVRAAADTEYIWRIQAAHGKGAVRVVHPEVPLSFSLSQEDSLTRSGPTHVKTIFYGTRRVYREAQRWWHQQAADGQLELRPGQRRRFPAPPNLLSKRPGPRHYDLLLVGDFSLRIGAGAYAQSLVEAAVAQGLRVGIFHWRRYEKPAMRPVRDLYQALAAAGGLDIIAAEDALTAQTALVADVMAVRHLLDWVPEWQVDRVLIATGHTGGSGFPDLVDYAPAVVAEHVESAFGRAAWWVAVSEPDRDCLRADPAYVNVADFVVPAPVPRQVFQETLPEAAQRTVRLGRFALGEGGSWPEEGEAFRKAYCADQPCQVSLLGLGRSYRSMFAPLPGNWSVDSAVVSDQVQAFSHTVSGLDLFLHYPGETRLDAGGRSVYEAMARGLPVIAPPSLEVFFGDGARYAEPEQAWEAARSLWANPDDYQAQAEAARRTARALADGAQILAALCPQPAGRPVDVIG